MATLNLSNVVCQSQLMDTFNIGPYVDPNHNYEIIEGVLTQLYNDNFPLRKVRYNKYRHKDNDWITAAIMRSIKYKDKLYRKLKQTCQNDGNHIILSHNIRVYNKILHKTIIQAKKMHYAKLFGEFKRNLRKAWDAVKQLLHTNSS